MMRQGDKSGAGRLGQGKMIEKFRIDDADLQIPSDSLNDRLRGRLRDGGYEHFERDLARAHIRPGDRVLDLGSGAGLVAIVAARIVGPENVTTVEANPEMHDVLRRNLRNNAGTELRMIKGAVVGDDYPDRSVTLNLRAAFWAASLDAPKGGKGARQVEVPAKKFRQLVRARDANVLTMDIEGAEDALLSQPLPDSIRLLIVELHPGLYGEARRDELLQGLVTQGFRNLQPQRTEDVYAFGRDVSERGTENRPEA